MADLSQMKLLINLARIDGTVATRERNYIINIGRANGVYPDQVEPLFDQRHELIVPQNLSAEEKFNCIFSLVQLMKIDERMYKEEMLFCSKIATTLGYDQEVMFELLMHVKASAMTAEEKENIKRLTEKHLKS
ncbi:MAG TPA: hypothetical protein VGK59_21655 [Ohtaekwangia sp.]